MTKKLVLTAAVFGLILAQPGMAAQGQGKGKSKGHSQEAAETHGNGHKPNGNHTPTRAFGKNDRSVILSFFREQPGGLPPGLAKRDRLPPGLEKQLQRNGHLPKGLEDKIEPFPAGLAVHFPPLESGYRRGFVGGMALIYRQGGLIVDLLDLR